MMHYNKNESKIKILKIPIVWIKISKTSILDHIGASYAKSKHTDYVQGGGGGKGLRERVKHPDIIQSQQSSKMLENYVILLI